MSTLKVNNLEDLGADPVAVNGVLVKSAFPAGTILQVVSATKTDTFTTSSTSYVDITDFSATITPTSVDSKILISASVIVGASGNNDSSASWRITGGNALNYVGDADGSRTRGLSMQSLVAGGIGPAVTSTSQSGTYLDSPATTSPVTYQVQLISAGVSRAVYLNRTVNDANSALYVRGASTITLMEVAG